MRIEAKLYDFTYTIETSYDDLDLEAVRDDMLIPLLLALGFHPDSVNDLFFDDSEAISGDPDDLSEFHRRDGEVFANKAPKEGVFAAKSIDPKIKAPDAYALDEEDNLESN